MQLNEDLMSGIFNNTKHPSNSFPLLSVSELKAHLNLLKQRFPRTILRMVKGPQKYFRKTGASFL